MITASADTYEIIAETTPDLLAIGVSGNLSETDYKRLHPWLDERLDEHPCPSMLIVMKDFEGVGNNRRPAGRREGRYGAP